MTSWLRPVPRLSVSTAMAFVAAAAGAVIWFGFVTHSSSNVAQLAKAAQSQGVDLLPNRAQGGGLLGAYLNGNTVTPLSPEQYTQLVRTEYEKTKLFVHPLPDAGNARTRSAVRPYLLRR